MTVEIKPDLIARKPALGPTTALGLLIVGSALLRLLLASALGPGNDEAYHYLFTLHPAGGYFDHPPMLAWVETIGLSLTAGGPNVTALRVGFIALFAGSTWILARLTNRLYPRNAWAGFWAAVGLNLSAYYGVAAATFALPDGPLLFFWLLTLDRLAAASEKPDSIRSVAWVGIAWGCALLSKYHAVFLPAGCLLFVLVHRPARNLAIETRALAWRAAVGLGLFAPVIIWNA